MPAEDRKKVGLALASRPRNSSESSGQSLKSPRTPRFAEATAVNSPIDPPQPDKSPFADPPMTRNLVSQPSDVGFGYIADTSTSRHASQVDPAPLSPGMKSPLKSALKSPNTPGRNFENVLSPTFREEQHLEKYEDKSSRDNAKDVKIKTRVRMAKMLLRGVNFSCSLIILSMVSSTFAIFNATKALPTRNALPAWAPNTKIWPQVTLLSIACISLAFCLLIFWRYFNGGHRRAEKAAVYHTLFALAAFVFSLVMWGIAAGVLVGSKQSSNSQDMWGWACKDNKRQQLFKDKVHYGLVCRLQNWSLICIIIEVIVEIITISIYSVIFYRFYSKNRLRKTMDLRDKARSDLYLAQFRSQSAPNTPGFYPMTPTTPGGYSQYNSYDNYSKAEEGGYGTPQFAKEANANKAGSFTLQAPPIKIHQATPTMPQEGFESTPTAPGEVQYASVPIPGAYSAPGERTPTAVQAPASIHMPGQAMTTDGRVASPGPR